MKTFINKEPEKALLISTADLSSNLNAYKNETYKAYCENLRMQPPDPNF